ncbi:Uronate dehydrogenase [Rhizobium rhizogenes]|uniref:Uronate dehydrogenase n=1 Tax=Rhizobium rhizogenes TaxID=359 RepID=A0AAN2A7H8_RHIRH|nr:MULTISPECIES: NAD(P)-dependent oxidoreductase [Rhizobium/Agrobacterium group]AQS64855.1 NAD(P)-dependent oxidoreductase [Rhizobium rhizogenes]MCZ7444413.1 NAD(P)-dependent oxidoreductase [Rhizobium rhizogenes]NSZ80739.1 NAD(P)-dependent oxidoreductase [Agrobacterium tumefaciens]OAM62093.1 NAD-dependent dehydratase [Rhizobium rhizogenes]CAD0215037.1 Uronate dehydrogenase [Rhizobium rhizogenes]
MLKRLLITGAGGKLGSMLRGRLGHVAETIRLSDVVDLGEAAPHEELVRCRLEDEAAVHELVKGCDGIVHLGGISVEKAFDPIEAANLRGVYNLYDAARQNDLPRILFASSNHTIGYYPQGRQLEPETPFLPDGLYGVSKIFGEAMASLYHSKFGQETAIVRIGSCEEKPTNWRMLSTWLSYGDFVSLIEATFRVPKLGCPVIWGVSANDDSWWDNSHVDFLGWQRRDNAAHYRAEIERDVPRPDPGAAIAKYQGGIFTDEPIHRT